MSSKSATSPLASRKPMVPAREPVGDGSVQHVDDLAVDAGRERLALYADAQLVGDAGVDDVRHGPTRVGRERACHHPVGLDRVVVGMQLPHVAVAAVGGTEDDRRRPGDRGDVHGEDVVGPVPSGLGDRDVAAAHAAAAVDDAERARVGVARWPPDPRGAAPVVVTEAGLERLPRRPRGREVVLVPGPHPPGVRAAGVERLAVVLDVGLLGRRHLVGVPHERRRRRPAPRSCTPSAPRCGSASCGSQPKRGVSSVSSGLLRSSTVSLVGADGLLPLAAVAVGGWPASGIVIAIAVATTRAARRSRPAWVGLSQVPPSRS